MAVTNVRQLLATRGTKNDFTTFAARGKPDRVIGLRVY
ncbi:hypothetical protein MGWOODY_Hyp1762 [hydrothermal vent metagenome]|uniref:Uncharacterized protein n=1 Tax=hydrothermal vent metagenome TaxID=652676 RepID=A0A160TVU7_9ZZZZ